MYVISLERIVAKRGEGEHRDRLFFNKSVDGVENTPEGMAELGTFLASAKVGTRKVGLIGRGMVAVAEVAEAMIEGDILAYQYHGENHESPKWQISLGFQKDVDTKNAGYAKKRTGKKSTKKSTKAKARVKTPLLS